MTNNMTTSTQIRHAAIDVLEDAQRIIDASEKVTAGHEELLAEAYFAVLGIADRARELADRLEEITE